MIERWMEPFSLMEDRSVPDRLGGQTASFAPSTPFQGVMTWITGSRVNAAGQTLPVEHPVLLHEKGITLHIGDRVQRVKDGALYRVTSPTGEMQPPEGSALPFAQVSVERVVIP